MKFILTALSLSTLMTNYSFGQGCSDAGFCTINSFKPGSSGASIDTLTNQFKIGTLLGRADKFISVYGSYLEFNKQLNKKFGTDIKLTTLVQNGNGISANGFSDVFLNANYQASDKLKLTLGTKIPLSNSGKSLNKLPLPMDYQSSLGTFDLIFGVGYEINKLQVVAAVQQPLTQNDNQFFASSYSFGSKLRTFQSTRRFRRMGDVLFRISYPILFNHKLRVTPSILPIYHLANDKYSDEFNFENEIKGSQGLTLNGNIYLDFEMNRKNKIQINVGIPFVVRDSRPDGLTRSFIINLEYSIKF